MMNGLPADIIVDSSSDLPVFVILYYDKRCNKIPKNNIYIKETCFQSIP